MTEPAKAQHPTELSPPPELPEHGLRIVPLGGLGAIGRNMTVFEHAGRLLIVDCGVLFPENDQPGVDLILPDFTTIADRLDDVEAVVLTHGHEDHIGGVPYVLRLKPDLPLVGSRFTLALVEAKLREHRIAPYSLQVAEGQTEQLGPFSCEFFAVNHSIPDALAVAIRTEAGLVLHTGDFKMDQTPLDGRLTDFQGFARLGAEGVALLLSDSTNADVPGFVPSEQEIGPVLRGVISEAPARVIVACVSSQVHRIQQTIDAAAASGRRVAFLGRSMVRNMAVATELGYLTVPDGILVEPSALFETPGGEIVLICTGSQGEPLSVLARMANRDHKIRIGADDTVVLAASLIPGNENAVYRVINALSRWGATVIHKGNSMVHVSGHAAAGELLLILNTVLPHNFIPVHGEWRHLRAHAALAVAAGVSEENIILADDGVAVDLTEGRAAIVGKVPCGYVYIDGLDVGEVGEASLKDRRILGEEGLLTIVVVVDSNTGNVAAGPDIYGRGFVDDPGGLAEARQLVSLALEQARADDVTDVYQLRQLIRRTVGRWVGDTRKRRPMILPVVIET